jgi:hypothetical protein
MENKSNSDNKSYLRFLRNYAIAILTIVALMICYYAMWDKTDFVFGTLNDLLGILFSYLYLLAILCLHPVMIINAIKGEKGGQTSENKPHAKITGKPPSPEEIAQNKEKWKKTYRRISMAVMQLIIVDIVVTILWWIPTWPRWIALFLFRKLQIRRTARVVFWPGTIEHHFSRLVVRPLDRDHFLFCAALARLLSNVIPVCHGNRSGK